MIYIQLIIEFFKIGLLSFGGGYATIPFLYHISQTQSWYSIKELSNMIAVAAVTPGPIGINMATFTGYKTAGIIGSALATTSEMLPSLIIVIIISKLIQKHRNNFYTKTIIETLKPISCALLLFVFINLIKPYITDIKAIVLLFLLLAISTNFKKTPLFYILFAGIIGISLVIFSVS